MSNVSTAVTAEDAASGAVAALAELVATLSAARDEQSILAATMNHLSRFAPSGARLAFLRTDSQGIAVEMQPIATWSHGQVATISGEAASHRPAWDDPLLKLLAEKPAESLFLEASSDGKEGAFALLRLRSDSSGQWQGLLLLTWSAPHTFTDEERSTYRLLTFGLAMYMNSLHSQRELGAALQEAALLHEVTKRLNVALSLDEALRALMIPAPDRDAAEVALCSFELDEGGNPVWCKLISAFKEGNRAPDLAIGTRYYLPDIPFAKLYLSSPDEPLVIADVTTDPRVDEYACKLYGQVGTRSTLLMALTLQGRWVGLFNISWKRPMPIGEREKRVYHALAKQAALLLDNSMMVERLRESLKETQEQGALMQRILDHIPVGVTLLDGQTLKPLLGNAFMDRMLGRHLDGSLTNKEIISSYHFVTAGTEQRLPLADLPSQRVVKSKKMEIAELDILPPDGERVSCEATAVPVFDENNGIKHIIVLLSDLTVRKRAELERTRLQEEIIRVQAATLAERSSPLIPITDEILVLPLIGSIDTERGHQVLDSVLQGVSQRGARVAIIDITGVRTVDTQAAQALTNAAQALRLLGVDPVLTGIRPEVAQTLVSLGVRLEGIVTRSTLQSGIQYALKRLNKRAIG